MTPSPEETPPSEQQSHRKKRKDAGQPRWEERDYYVLQWIGMQGAIRFDQLQRLLGRESPERHDWNAVLSASATRNAINRWEMKHLVNAAHIMPKEPKYYWLSSAGFQFVELNLPHYSPKRRDMSYLLACNQVRLSIELRNRLEKREFGDFEHCRWVSQRELQLLDPEHKTHVPVGQFNTQTRGMLAIEVISSQEDVEPIMQAYAQSPYAEIWYYADTAHLPLLDQTREQIRKSGIDVSKIYIFNGDTILVPAALPKRLRAKRG